nr:hypothetical protein [Tanacetum cinerariifolium]
MDDPNITMKEYIILKEEKARRRAIVFNYTLTSETTLSYEPTVSYLNDEIDFRVSFDDSDDEDYTRMRVEQYIQMIDYALWDIIENGSTLPKTQVVKGVTTLMPIKSLEDKAQRTLERNKADLDTLSMDDLYNNLKIHPDDLKEINLRWKMAMLTMRARRFLKKTGSKLTVNGNKTIRFDKTNVEYYNCHKRGHFARECRAIKSQDTKHKKRKKRTVPMETPVLTTLESCDGLGGYDWSDQAEKGPNYALMAYTSTGSDSKVSNDFTCSKSCLESVKLLKSQNEQLLKDLKKSELMVLGYKSGLESVEERLKFFKTNEFIYLEDIKLLKVKIQMKDIAIKELSRKLKIVNNGKKELGYETYNAVPSPYTGNFMPLKPDLSYIGLNKFAVKPVVKNKSSEEETNAVRKNPDALIVEDWVSDDEEENVT